MDEGKLDLVKDIIKAVRSYDESGGPLFAVGGTLESHVGKLIETYQEDSDECYVCGARVRQYWHKITPHLVHALAKSYGYIAKQGENAVNPTKSLDATSFELTKDERANWTKLRFHGLIAKCKDEKGGHRRGWWLITKRGAQFLRGELAIPVRVLTYRNHVIDHDEKRVTVGDTVKSPIYIETLDNIEFEVGTP